MNSQNKNLLSMDNAINILGNIVAMVNSGKDWLRQERFNAQSCLSLSLTVKKFKVKRTNFNFILLKNQRAFT
jgi:hypothetical protein